MDAQRDAEGRPVSDTGEQRAAAPSRENRIPAWCRRLLAALISVYAGIVLALSWLYFTGPERWWVSGIVQYAPQWIWAAPAIAFIPLVIRVRWTWIWAPILVVVWVAGPLMGFCFPRGGSSVYNPSKRLRVMTYNIQWGRDGWEKLARQVIEANPDLLLLQDARTGVEGALKDFLSEWKVKSFGQFVIASRYDLSKAEVGDVSYRGQTHTYLLAELKFGGVSTTVADVHFATPRSGLQGFRYREASAVEEVKQGIQDRLGQARSVAERLGAVSGPVILAGDFNAPPMSMISRAFEQAGLRDAFSAAGFGYGYTFGHQTRLRHAYLRIDHIYTSRHWRPVECVVKSGPGSDHYPVIADLELNGDRP